MSEKTLGEYNVNDARFWRLLDKLNAAAFWRRVRASRRPARPTFFTTPHRRRPVGPGDES